MPPSEDIPIIGEFYLYTMALVSTSILITICVLSLHHGPSDPPPGNFIQPQNKGVAILFLVKEPCYLLEWNDESSKLAGDIDEDHICKSNFSKTPLKTWWWFPQVPFYFHVLFQCYYSVVQKIHTIRSGSQRTCQVWKVVTTALAWRTLFRSRPLLLLSGGHFRKTWRDT